MKSPLARIRRQARKLRRAAQYDRHAFWRKQPIRPGTVLYESFSGNGALCNPEAIFRGLIADPEFAAMFRHYKEIRRGPGLDLYDLAVPMEAPEKVSCRRGV